MTEIDWDAPPLQHLDRRTELIAAATFHKPGTQHPYAHGTRVEYIEPRRDEITDRWEVVRAGERDEILWPVRRAIAMRDNFTCRICHTPASKFEIDHIVPWSAGGSDKSVNLRLLCVSCNQTRGNKIDGDERPAMPVTWWCVRCWADEFQWERAGWVAAGAVTDWLNIDHRVEVGYVQAFCGYCKSLSATDVTL